MLASIGLLVVLTTLVYWPGLDGGFILDDLHAVSDNPAIAVDSLSWESLQRAATSFHSGLSGREIPMTTFALDHYVWENNVMGYKLSGLIVHLLNALLVFLLASRILAQDPVSDNRPWPKYAAALIALVWAIHPLQVSTVLYVVQRMETLAVMFILLGLLAYMEGRWRQVRGRRCGWIWIVFAGMAMVPGFMSKETAVLLPLFALTYEWAVLRFRAHNARDSRVLTIIYSVGAVLALVIFLAVFVPRYMDPVAFSGRDFTWYERLLSQLRVLPLYLSWMVWPDPQRYLFFYDTFQSSTGWLKPFTTLIGGVFLAGLATAAVLVRRSLPLFSLGIAWFLCAHVLTSNILPLELIFEHRNYFALFGILLALASIIRWIAFRFWQPPGRTMGTVMVVGLAGLTWVHSATWGDPLNLAMDLKAKNPASTRAGYQLGQEYLEMSGGNPASPFFEFAEAEFERVRQFENSSPMPERVLIGMRTRAGEPVEEGLWLDLIEKIESQPVGADHIKAVHDLLATYNRGVGLDESYLMDAGVALLNSGRMFPYSYLEFGIFVLEGVGDEEFATTVLSIGSNVATSDDWNQVVLRVLRQRGHHDFASRLESRH